jgi:hypothetical protein
MEEQKENDPQEPPSTLMLLRPVCFRAGEGQSDSSEEDQALTVPAVEGGRGVPECDMY